MHFNFLGGVNTGWLVGEVEVCLDMVEDMTSIWRNCDDFEEIGACNCPKKLYDV